MEVLSKPESRRGPAEWFTGEVLMEPMFEPSGASRVQAARVSFRPGARTAWHTHPAGQMLYVVEGTGWVQLRGEPARVITVGDVVRIAADEDHWHGASAGIGLVHLAVQEKDESGKVVTWGTQVTDEEYGAA